LCRG
jgi:hypothetical protein